jgi:single-strand DNA-binding protein
MASLNRIILVGKLSADPEVRFTVEGVQVAKFQLEVERFATENAPKQTDRMDVVAWRRLAEICGQYLKKGKLVLVEGRIQIRAFDTDAGSKKWATEIVARSIKMLGANPTKEEIATAGASAATDSVPGIDELPEEESDLPF